MSLCTKHRGKYLSTTYLSIDRVQLVFEMPLS